MTTEGLSGDLEALPLLDTLNVLSRHRRSGPLTLKTESDEITIRFVNGQITSVTTSDQALRIGQILLAQGFVTEEQIEQALALQSAASNPDRIGDVLVDVGHVTPEQINRAVAAQVEASLVRILTHSRGTFRYVPETPNGVSSITSVLDFEPLVMNATYLADQRLADRSPADSETLPEDLIDPAILERLSPDEREVMRELIDVYAELHDLAWRIGSSARSYKQAVLRLLEQAMVRIATEGHEDQQVTRRPNARYEQAHLLDENIDPWILEGAPTAAKELLLDMLNGVTGVYALAQRSEHGSDAFDHALLYLLDERLVHVEMPDGAPVEERPTEPSVPNATFRFRAPEISRDVLFDLSKSERRTLIAMLNGYRSLHAMSTYSGLPASLYREGADRLLERGVIDIVEG